MTESKTDVARILSAALSETILERYPAELCEAIFPRGTAALKLAADHFSKSPVVVPISVKQILDHVSGVPSLTRLCSFGRRSLDRIIFDLSAELCVMLEILDEPSSADRRHPDEMRAVRLARTFLSAAGQPVPEEVQHWLAKVSSARPDQNPTPKSICNVLEFRSLTGASS